MRRSSLLLLAAACTTISFADNAQAVRKILTANYKAIGIAFQKKDNKSIAAMLTDDYTATPPKGPTLNKTQICQDMQRQMNMISNATWARNITSLKLDGNHAIAVVHGNFHGTMAGQDAKPHDFKLDAITTDTWLKAGKGYKLQKSVVSKQDVTFDGKKIGQPG